MNPFLRMLMGQQGGTSTGGTFGSGPNPDGTLSLTGSEQDTTNNIPVNMDRMPKFSSEDDPNAGPVFLGNTGNVQATEQAVRKGQEVSDRKGMFGVKGTLRDVLGLVGDAFLVQGGRNPYYQPLRRQENISDAMAGFTENPEAAAERVAYYDPKMGQEILTDAETSLLKKAQLESLKSSRASDIQTEELARFKRVRDIVAGLFNTPGAVVDGKINPQALQVADRMAKAAGLTLEDLLITADMDEQQVREYAMSALDPYKQETLEDRDATIAQGDRNATSREISARASMIRAQRPPAGRAPANPTEASEFARIRAKLNRGETLSAGDKATWDKYTRPPSSSEKKTRTVPGSKPKPSVSNW
jgi:hypothetical protein